MPERPSSVDIAVILLPAFNAHATTAFIDPLRAANYLQAQHLFRWRFFSLDGGLLVASNAMALDTSPLAQLEQRPDMIVVSASWTPEAHRNERLLRTLRAKTMPAQLIKPCKPPNVSRANCTVSSASSGLVTLVCRK